MGQQIKIVMDIMPGLWYEGTGVNNLVIRNNEFELGTIPGGFRMKDGSYEDICPYYIEV